MLTANGVDASQQGMRGGTENGKDEGMGRTYIRVRPGIIESDLWSEPHHIRVAWFTILARAGRTGRVPFVVKVAELNPGLPQAGRTSDPVAPP